MIESVLKRRRPTDVVIMQTADMIMRSTASLSLPAIDPPSGILGQMEEVWLETMNLDQLNASYEYVRKWALGKTNSAQSLRIEDDYVTQSSNKKPSPTAEFFDKGRIRPANVLILRRIADLCKKEALNCIYINGPLASPVCEEIQSYFDAVKASIEGAGLVVAGERSVCLSGEEIGDTPEHAAPAAKSEVTSRYVRILSPYLSVVGPQGGS